ncbi:MAG TPA: peptidyl-prolyl cis-trans isomerase [Candidatus Edwardsbacteria bacterium]|nr:peptidyl-prolyl cis-trans isomerase [Candidatus Edwardsbacteria bacterium]
MMRRFAPWGVLFLALLALSCSRADRVIAKVGSQKLTIGEFEQFYKQPVMAKDTAEVSAAKHKMLDQMVEEKLLLCEATAQGYDKDPEVAREIEEISNNVLIEWLYRQEFLKKFMPGDGDVKDFYKKLGIQVKARHIMVKTEAEAKDLIAVIKDKRAFDRQFAGKTFDEQVLVADKSAPAQPQPGAQPGAVPPGMKVEQRTATGATLRERFMIVAKEKSAEPMTAARGGDLSWFGWGQTAPGFDEFQETVFSLSPGRLSKPVKTPYGYHIILIDSTKRTENLPPLDQIKDRIKMQLEQQAFAKANQRAQQYVNDMLQGARIVLDTAATRLLAEKQLQQYGAGVNPFPQLDSAQLAHPVASFKGGTLSCRELQQGTTLFFHGGVDLASPDSVRKYVERIVSRSLLVARAKSQGLERMPKVKLHIALKVQDKLAGQVYLKEVQERIGINDEMVKQYYQGNKKDFFRPAQAYVDLILVKTRPEAEQVVADLNHGANFAALARERSLDETRQAGGTLGPVTRDNAAYPEIAAKAFALGTGAISAPFAAKGGFAVIRVSRREEAKQFPFDEVKDRARQALTAKLADQRYQDLVTALKAKFPVTVDAKALAAAGQSKDDEQ